MKRNVKGKLLLIIVMILFATLFIKNNVDAADDNTLELLDLSLSGDSEVIVGDKLYLDIKTSENVENVSIEITDGSYSGVAYVGDLNGNAYLPLDNVMGNTAPAGNYKIKSVYLWGTNNTQVKYTTTSSNEGEKILKYNVQFSIVNETNDITLKNIAISGSSEVKIGGKLYLDIETTGDVKYISMNITNGSDSEIIYISDINGNAYLPLENLKARKL